MKKLLLIFALLTIAVVGQTQKTLIADTMGNSQSRIAVYDIPDGVDSVRVGLFATGEIDLDSLDVKFGVINKLKYRGSVVSANYAASSSATYSKALTVDNADGVETYSYNIVTIPASAWAGYNYIKFTLIAASSGNDGSDTKQKALLVLTAY